ncbi:MAG: DEAD/DEAH box helicase family protein [Thaumarchaeota archaeon]|nr:DEAD/DEAH box helicase family protein [Nitrososphaerota archaeon]
MSGEPNSFDIDVDSILKRYALADRRDYQVDCIRDTAEGLRQGNDVLIDLPTGTGKTVIYSPVVAELSEKGVRTLVLTATKRAQKWVGQEIKRFTGGKETPLVFGIQEYHCPILKANAQNWCCGELKETHCKPTGIRCGVILAEEDYKNSNLVVTNFSKFLLATTDSKHDLIVLDDSHSFENTKEQAYQISLQFALVRQAYEAQAENSSIRVFLENFLNLISEISERCVNPGEKEGPIPADYLSQLARLLPDSEEEAIEKEIRKLSGRDGSVVTKVFYFVRRCKAATRYQFYVQKDFYDPDDWDSSELVSKNDQFVDFVVKRRFGKARVIFATATSGEAISHATACTLKAYDSTNLSVTPKNRSSYPEIQGWFGKLRILVVEDIGDTRQPNSFERAMSITVETLKNRTERELVLFKNYRDQRRANEILSKVFPQSKLFFFDNSIDDGDVLEELANQSQISLASASSTLWEGINIKDLRIAIIVSPPFNRPQVGQKMNYPISERKMLVRLQQGIGRIIRSPKDWGVALLLDSRFDNYLNKRAFNPMLKEQVESLKADEVVSRVNELFETWGRQ